MQERPFELTEELVREARVVVVDDDPLVTGSLCSFLSQEVGLEPVVFNESPRAAGYLRDHEIDLIISGFLMAGKDGIQLLAEVKHHYPEAARILLTGYGDKENAIRAINEVRVFKYLEKPWDNDQLRDVVLSGLERAMLMRRVGARIEELSRTHPDLVGLRDALVHTFA